MVPQPGTPVPLGPAAVDRVDRVDHVDRVERTSRDAAATRAVGAALGRCLRRGTLVTLSGGLGAGKTTFTQGIAVGLGITGRVASPTYVLMRGHALDAMRTGEGGRWTDAAASTASLDVEAGRLVHADLYRIHSAMEALELGLDECRADGDVVVVEWPENARGALGDADVAVSLAEVAEVAEVAEIVEPGEHPATEADTRLSAAFDVQVDGDREAGAAPGQRRIVVVALSDVGRSILRCLAAAEAPRGDKA